MSQLLFAVSGRLALQLQVGLQGRSESDRPQSDVGKQKSEEYFMQKTIMVLA